MRISDSCMSPDMKRIISSLCLICLLVWGGSSSVRAQDYVLQPGDVLDITVAGLPELGRTIRIPQNGTISLPLVGRMVISGMPVGEAEDAIAQALSNKIFRQRGPSGVETLFSIDPEEVAVVVSEYLPVYVGGDVRNPGAQAFIPGLTVRRAIALSGGLNMQQYEGPDASPQIANLMTRNRILKSQLDTSRVRVGRLREQLASTAEGSAPDPAALASEDSPVADVEQERLGVAVSQIKENESFLSASRSAVEREITLLQQQLDDEVEGEEADREEYERLSGLLGNGLISADRLVNARRSLLLSSTRRLETTAQLAARERELARLDYELSDLHNVANRDVLRELSDELADQERITAEIAGVREQLVLYGAEVGESGDLTITEITIHRSDGTRVPVPEDGDEVLLPGDLVSVEIQVNEGASSL